jgi:ABC-type antimicrobial peptide transport system permease subunit
MGATRAQVVRQFLVESLVFSTVAGALGVLAGLGSLSAIQSTIASQLPPNTTLTLNSRALAFTGGVTLISALLTTG